MLVILLAFLLLIIRPLKEYRNTVLLWAGLVIFGQVAFHFGGVPKWMPHTLFLVLLGVHLRYGRFITSRQLIDRILFGLPFLLSASMPTRFIDAGRYYNQSVRWFIEGIPKGLANFDLYLIQLSGAHSTEAILTSATGKGYDVLIPLIASMLIANGYSSLADRKYSLPLLLITFGLLTHFGQTASPDLLGAAFIIAYYVRHEDFASVQSAVIAGLLILIKPVFLPVSILILSGAFRQKQATALLVFIALGLFAAFKLYWSAGWLPFVGGLGLPWSFPKEAADLLGQASIGEAAGNRGTYILEGLRWRWIDTILIIVYLLAVFFLRNRISSRFMWAHLLLGLFFLILVPQSRFVLGPVLVLFLQTEGYATWLRKVLPRRPALLACAIGLIAVLPEWSSVFSQPRVQHFFAYGGFQHVNWILPHPNWEIETKQLALEGGSLFYVPEDNYCFDSSFPCCSEYPKRFVSNGEPNEYTVGFDAKGGYFYSIRQRPTD